MLRVIENLHQATLIPELLAKKGAEASVHLSLTESVLSEDGKVYPDSRGPQDVHEHDEEIIADARALLAKISARRAARAGVPVRVGTSITEPPSA